MHQYSHASIEFANFIEMLTEHMDQTGNKDGNIQASAASAYAAERMCRRAGLRLAEAPRKSRVRRVTCRVTSCVHSA